MSSEEIVYLEYSDIRLYLDTISNQFKFEIKIGDENALKSAFNTPKNSYNNNLYQIAFSYAKWAPLKNPCTTTCG